MISQKEMLSAFFHSKSGPAPIFFTFYCSRIFAKGNKRRPNLALVCCAHFVLLYILLWTHVRFCCVRIGFSVLSQQTDWEEHLQNDLFCVGWDVKP